MKLANIALAAAFALLFLLLDYLQRLPRMRF